MPGWQKWDSKAQVVFGTSKWHGLKDLSGECLLAWDHNYLYLAARVTDNHVEQPYFGVNMWNGDYVMLLLDVPRQATGARDNKRVFHLGFSPGSLRPVGQMSSPPEVVNFASPNGDSHVAGAKIGSKRTAVGYDLEASIPWTSLGVPHPEEGLALGYDIVVSDADAPVNPVQEKLASLLTSPWSMINPNRLIDAYLGQTTGAVDPEKIVNDQGAPLGDMLSIDPGQTTSVAADHLPGVQELQVKARLVFGSFGGGSPGMQIKVNGTPLDMTQIRNRLASFMLGVDEVGTFPQQGWYLLYAPDYTPPDSTSPYYTAGLNPYDFRFDVTGLWNPDHNTIEVTNTHSKVPLAVELATSDHLSPKILPPPVVPAPTGEIPSYEPVPALKTSLYTWSLLPGGAVEVDLGTHHWTAESGFSTINPSWATLGGSQPDVIWKNLSRHGDVLEGATADFKLKRTVESKPDHLVVTDELTNTSGTDLPVILRHTVAPGPDGQAIYIAGRKVETPQFYTAEGETPTALALGADAGLGMAVEDDVLRAQGREFFADGKMGFDDPFFVLAKGTTFKTSYSLYPLEQADPYLFINRVRSAWDVNFTVKGSSACTGDVRLGHEETTTDEDIRKTIEIKGTHYFLTGFPMEGSLCVFGNRFHQVNLEKQRAFIGHVREVAPDAEVLPYYHVFISNADEDKTTFAKDRLINPDGTQADYRDPLYPLYVPREGSDFAKMEEGLADMRFDDMGANGVYWDEMEFSESKWDYNTDYWDGFSGNIDPDTHQLQRKVSNVILATQSWRIKMAKKILARGGLVANGAPQTRSMMDVHFPRFAETGSITDLAKEQLYSPISLGDLLTERNELDVYHDIVKALNFGCVYYWYHPQVSFSYPTLTSYMFPITPVRLGNGFILGEERILTNTSGYFGWGDRSTFEAKVYDDKGRETTEIRVPLATREGKNFAEVRIPSGYSVALIREKSAVALGQ